MNSANEKTSFERFLENVDLKLNVIKSFVKRELPESIRVSLTGRIKETNEFIVDVLETVEGLELMQATIRKSRNSRAINIIDNAPFSTKSFSEREVHINGDPQVIEQDYMLSIVSSKLELARELNWRLKSLISLYQDILSKL